MEMQSLRRVEGEIKRIAALAGGTVGVRVLHIESGHKLALNPSDHFPMASTCKVAIAVRLLKLIDKEHVALHQMIELTQHDLSPGSGIIGSHLYHPGVTMSVHNLLETMLTVSDNTATDVLLNLIGGPKAVTDFLRASGIEGMRIDRSIKSLLADAYGLSGFMSFQRFKEYVNTSTAESQKAAVETFLADPRDTSTPDAMVSLLERIYHRELLKEESTELLLDIMQRCQTGESRLRSMLPPGTVVSNKTGTLRRITVNDVGIITLPDDAGHLVLSVLTKSLGKGDFVKVAECQHVIAHVARAVYDFFLFAP